MEMNIGANCVIHDGCDIQVHGTFQLGDRGFLGEGTKIRGNNVIIGKDFFSDGGLEIGGGGCNWPSANLVIGDRCTIHNSHININQQVTIGDDVGFSPDVDVITHGYWLSELDGFPAKFSSVSVFSGAIVGWRSVVLMGSIIGKNCVVGAQSVVAGTLAGNSVYAGNPAKFIRKIVPMSDEDKREEVSDLIGQYQIVASYHGIRPKVVLDYPYVYVNGAWFNVLDFTYSGREDNETDDFRDFARHFGLRFYTERPFRSVWKW
jgi:acetyltransferase-like isoleucine patch superfamily enzyme